MTHSPIASYIWTVDMFKRGKYQDIILPLIVRPRIDQGLEPTEQKVLKTYKVFKSKLDNPDDQLRKASGYAFYNTTLYGLTASTTPSVQTLRR